MKKLTFVLVLVMLAALLAGCSNSTTIDSESETVAVDVIVDPEKIPIFADLIALPGHADLYYSLNTRTIYYVHSTRHGQSSVAFMAPYIKNGHYCEYVDGQIVEVFD